MAEYPLDSVPDAKPSTMPAPGNEPQPDTAFDALIIGAGPTGLSCAIEVPCSLTKAASATPCFTTRRT